MEDKTGSDFMAEKRTYTLLITKGNDPDGQYDFYQISERILRSLLGCR